MIKKIISAVVLTLIIAACSSSDKGDEKSLDNFDRQTMLINWADNIIIPVHQDLNTKLQALVTAKDGFVGTPNQTSLDALRTAWLNAYKVWQYAEMFNIGKAEAINYGYQMNVYPTTVTDIETNITNGTYDLAHANNNDAVGFPALDYLLYGVASGDVAILNIYTTNTNASGYKKYLSDLVNQMKTLTETVLNDWTSGYRDTFVNSTTNTATSATNKLTNDFIFYYEKGLRANKIGIPAGNFSTNPLPDKVEAYYNQEVSKVLALDAINAVQNFFNGKAYNTASTANSFKAYLDYLNIAKGGNDLSTLINNQLNVARTKLQALDANFTNQVNTDNSKMTIAFDELQKAVVLFKVDMVQAMNISVDYIDADGD
ncbi:imelysin family protein [Mariniflexile litorale]|uniref:Imelysin family protein n=1 Tax=Mariniflexile litorale TaxID=3045158 RepID=A0AAU7EHP6_9FLAO|nr:imelysin family protein [Mariniflexile sp. KMM 9835]MDQ8211699.1 imelysin family protein [Mariniflexile sp. KMM 9835]